MCAETAASLLGFDRKDFGIGSRQKITETLALKYDSEEQGESVTEIPRTKMATTTSSTRYLSNN